MEMILIGSSEGGKFLTAHPEIDIQMHELGFRFLQVHDSQDDTPTHNTIYSYCQPRGYLGLPSTSNPKIQKLSAPLSLRVSQWEGGRDYRESMNSLKPGLRILSDDSRHQIACYFMDENILFLCDIAHPWDTNRPNDANQQISVDVWKFVSMQIQDLKDAVIVHRPRIKLLIEDIDKISR